ncbi:Uncharacterised protein [uncultured archaeon]|nr:Uncharacterised protein [uncultured archaeon]
MRASPFSILVLGLLAFAIFGMGCLQPASVDRCTGSADRTGCLTFYATWYQEPETCYYINDMPARLSCLNSSTDTAASQQLQNNYAAYGALPSSNPRRPAAATPAPAPSNSAPTPTPAYVSPNSPEVRAQAAIDQCVAASPKATASADVCAKQLAVDQRNLTFCALIGSPDLRSSCILTTATNVKDASACNVFNTSADKQFCVYYSRGG